CTQALDFPLTF
nr:immunoglobulin light chain junction region [Macaca mulatta]MOX09615.1 immunoglobulin light chain junction region [Macaca mulatta]